MAEVERTEKELSDLADFITSIQKDEMDRIAGGRKELGKCTKLTPGMLDRDGSFLG